MKDKNHIGELKEDKYLGDMLQQQEKNKDKDNHDEEDDDEEDVVGPKFSPKSIDKYQFQFSYKDFKVDFILPCFSKPIFDKNLDITFQSMLNAAINLFFISTDESYKEKYKSFMSGSLDRALELDKKKEVKYE